MGVCALVSDSAAGLLLEAVQKLQSEVTLVIEVNCRHKHELTLIQLIQEPLNQAPMGFRLMEM